MSDEREGAGAGTAAHKRGSRGNIGTSPLVRPHSLIHALAARVGDYLYFPSPEPLYVVLGTVAANMLQGVPVWVMLVGVPSSGRTVMLEALAKVPRVHIIGAIKNPSALLSGVAQKDKGKNATGGVLRQIGGRGIMLMKDFTSMLSMPREPLAEAIGALREVYDGRWSRPLGTEGGKLLEWRGRIGFLGASTPALDRHYAVTGELGERWIYYRYAETDGYGETIKALGVENPESMMEELRELVSGFMDEMGLWWGCGIGCEMKHEHRPPPDKRELTDYEKNRLYAIASITVAARSPVPRDGKTREVIDIAQKEAPTRLSSALGQMYLGLEAIGLGEQERWGIVGRMALDSAPQIRAKVVAALNAVVRWMGDPKGGGLTIGEVRKVLQCSSRTTMLTVEDLCIHGVCEVHQKKRGGEAGEGKDEVGMGNTVHLTEWGKRQLELGWGKKGKEEWEKEQQE